MPRTSPNALLSLLETALPSLVPAQVSDHLLDSEDQAALMALWCVRVLTDARCYRAMLNVERYREMPLSRMLILIGFQRQQIDQLTEIDDLQLVDGLRLVEKPARQWLEGLESAQPTWIGVLGDNLRAMAKLLDLNAIEVQLLGFYTLINSEKSLESFFELLGDVNGRQYIQILARILNCDTQEAHQAISKQGRLHRSGLMRMDKHNGGEVSRRLELLDGFAELMISERQQPMALLSRYFGSCANAELSLSDYPHLAEVSDTLVGYLTSQKGQPGVNVLVYGEPGTGKTQWVKAVVSALNRTLYEVNHEDIDGDELVGSKRVSVYKLAQAALATQQDACVLFDEVEDVFPNDAFAWLLPARAQNMNKAGVNKLLETNPVPTFWITNSIKQIDKAYLRRFDMVVEINSPPALVRKTILQNLLKGLPVREAWINKLAKQQSLVPAVIERAVKVAKCVHPADAEPLLLERKIEKLINATLQAQGKSELLINSSCNSLSYSLDYLNTDLDLNRLVAGIQTRQQGRLCLYGLPGTGKTAFGHYIAEQLDKPLIIKRASDLLSPYVGEAEQNIAAAFKEAKKEGAVLQIDEADSFLQSREKAHRSWEVTQVNEMLTQMEAFEGVFIASTNLIKDLDAAAMRRFDVKLEFKPLKADQAWCLFEQLLAEHPLDSHARCALKAQLAQLQILTPGDFAAVKRKLSLGYQDLEPGLVFEALEEECRFKPGYQKSVGIGFLTELKQRHSA
ncbi:AAA family ATPase [Thiomicrospira cyclica]|uniref:AAA ATPase central domain protein n=1 Tax=Thiomicrospira cyclica (strain DSM 14477 / JCM 11371 / ALM1) TaxID=717773 RepID=F6DBT6_THICA|nr:ATP-binding protein [Thiomicrospira cyclica]AEG31322.1 AAA ATPase central domain protein [Thiomicrospira cyclica ALM1]